MIDSAFQFQSWGVFLLLHLSMHKHDLSFYLLSDFFAPIRLIFFTSSSTHCYGSTSCLFLLLLLGLFPTNLLNKFSKNQHQIIYFYIILLWTTNLQSILKVFNSVGFFFFLRNCGCCIKLFFHSWNAFSSLVIMIKKDFTTFYWLTFKLCSLCLFS